MRSQVYMEVLRKVKYCIEFCITRHWTVSEQKARCKRIDWENAEYVIIFLFGFIVIIERLNGIQYCSINEYEHTYFCESFSSSRKRIFRHLDRHMININRRVWVSFLVLTMSLRRYGNIWKVCDFLDIMDERNWYVLNKRLMGKHFSLFWTYWTLTWLTWEKRIHAEENTLPFLRQFKTIGSDELNKTCENLANDYNKYVDYVDLLNVCS